MCSLRKQSAFGERNCAIPLCAFQNAPGFWTNLHTQTEEEPCGKKTQPLPLSFLQGGDTSGLRHIREVEALCEKYKGCHSAPTGSETKPLRLPRLPPSSCPSIYSPTSSKRGCEKKKKKRKTFGTAI